MHLKSSTCNLTLFRVVVEVAQTLVKLPNEKSVLCGAHGLRISVSRSRADVMHSGIKTQPAPYEAGVYEELYLGGETKIANILRPANLPNFHQQPVMPPFWGDVPASAAPYFPRNVQPVCVQNVPVEIALPSVVPQPGTDEGTSPDSQQLQQTAAQMGQSLETPEKETELPLGVQEIDTEKPVEEEALKRPGDGEGQMQVDTTGGTYPEVQGIYDNVGVGMVSPGIESATGNETTTQIHDMQFDIDGPVSDLARTESPWGWESEQIPQPPIVPEAKAEPAQNVSVAGGLLQQMASDSSDQATTAYVQLKDMYFP